MVYDFFRARPSALAPENWFDIIQIIPNITSDWETLVYHLDIDPEVPEVMHWHRLKSLSVRAHDLLRHMLKYCRIWNNYHNTTPPPDDSNYYNLGRWSPRPELPPWFAAKVLLVAAKSPRFRTYEWLI